MNGQRDMLFKWAYASWGMGVNDYIVFSWYSKPVP